MIGFYDITENVYAHLMNDPNVNTVRIGDISDVDMNKQEIFPFAHMLVGPAEFLGSVVRFTLTISCMDIVDINKGDIRDETEPFKGLTNKQDVLNSMLAVLENLDRSFLQGALFDLDYELQGTASAEPFEDRFENLVTGWSGTFIVDVPNTVQVCGNTYAFGQITFSNASITFSNNNNA